MRTHHFANGAAVALLAAWCLLPATPARGDVKDAAQKLLSATVAVEMQAAPVPATPAEGVGGAEAAVNPQPERVSFASGTVVSADGLVVTCDVSRQESESYRVRLGNGQRLPAKIVATDRRSGLWLLKVEAQDLPFLEVAPEAAEVGQSVLSVAVNQQATSSGPASHDGRYLSTGLVTAAGQRVEGVSVRLLQSDVRGGLGSAGAPLADEEGKLVGVILGVPSANAEAGITFAVPSTFVADLLKARPAENAVVIHPAYLGVQLESVDESEGIGAKILSAVENSPAAQAGLTAGDIVVGINGEKVESPEEVSSIIGERTSGEKVTVLLRRAGAEQPVEVVLAERPAPSEPRYTQALSIELVHPGQYRLAPVQQQEQEVQALSQQLAALLQQRKTYQRVEQSQVRSAEKAENVQTAEKANVLLSQADGRLVPLTVYVQRSESERRQAELADEVKSLRADVQKLTERLQALADKLDRPEESSYREKAIQSLRDEFEKKLNDLVRQREGKEALK